MVAATQTTARPRQQDGTIGVDAKMSDANRLFFLRIALIVIGLTFIFGIYTLGVVWPSGWAWGQGHSHYLMMIIAVYATLGVFLLIASRNPYAHKSLIWFTVWSSVVHGLSWVFRLSPIRPSVVIWWEMCLRSFSWRLYLPC
jgi:hypothetical protein